MKKLKFEIKDFIFGFLLELLFKFAHTHKLVKFERVENDNVINYHLSIKTKRPIEQSLVEVEKETSEYLEKVSDKNSLKPVNWINGGFDPNSQLNQARDFNRALNMPLNSVTEFPIKGGIIKNRNNVD